MIWFATNVSIHYTIHYIIRYKINK